MITILYSAIIFIACTIGAIVGIGGGVIIKPLLDFIGIHSVETVGFISTCAVFAMSISSSIKHIKAKTPIKQKVVLLVSAGSVFGGIIGNEIFDLVLERLNSNMVKGIQAVIIAAFIIFVIIYINSKNIKSFEKIGFTVEPFGGREYAVSAVPYNLFGLVSKEVFLEMLDHLLEEGKEKIQQMMNAKLHFDGLFEKLKTCMSKG